MRKSRVSLSRRFFIYLFFFFSVTNGLSSGGETRFVSRFRFSDLATSRNLIGRNFRGFASEVRARGDTRFTRVDYAREKSYGGTRERKKTRGNVLARPTSGAVSTRLPFREMYRFCIVGSSDACPYDFRLPPLTFSLPLSLSGSCARAYIFLVGARSFEAFLVASPRLALSRCNSPPANCCFRGYTGWSKSVTLVTIPMMIFAAIRFFFFFHPGTVLPLVVSHIRMITLLILKRDDTICLFYISI